MEKKFIINSNDSNDINIKTNENLSSAPGYNTTQDENFINEKRICKLRFERNNKLCRTGFFCKIPNKESIYLLTTNLTSKEIKHKPPYIEIICPKDKEGKKSKSLKLVAEDDGLNYYCFEVFGGDNINYLFEIKENQMDDISDVSYSGYTQTNGSFETNKGKYIKDIEDNDSFKKKLFKFKEFKEDTLRYGGPIYDNDNNVIGILNGYKDNEKAHIVVPINPIKEDILEKINNPTVIQKNINNKKKNYKLWIIIMLLILLVFASVFFVLYFLMKNNNKTENGEKILNEQFINEKFINEKILWEKNYAENNYTDISEYIINETSQYRICVYGAKAEKGGKGCVQCAESSFEKGAIIQYRLGGKTSGGEGGKNCGWTNINKNAANGAGLSWANYSNYFFIVAGGGGGNSGSGRLGGDCEQNGAGKYGGKGATKDKGGQGGEDNSPSGDGTQFKGGNGSGVKGFASLGQYCGGGGGDGYYGGGGGDWGDKQFDGAGGGGSNYCKNNDGISCGETLLNKYDYSSIKIYKKIKSENK